MSFKAYESLPLCCESTSARRVKWRTATVTSVGPDFDLTEKPMPTVRLWTF